MSIEVSVSGNPIQASVTESGASVSVAPLSVAASVGAGIGPQGPTGPASVASVNGQTGTVVLTSASVSAASAVHGHAIADVTGLQVALDGKASLASTNILRVTTLNGLNGAVTVEAGSGITVSTQGSKVTISGNVPQVASVNGITGSVVLTSASVSAASAVHTHSTSDVTGLDARIVSQATNAAVVRSLNGITGVVVITHTSVSAQSVLSAAANTFLSDIDDGFDAAVENAGGIGVAGVNGLDTHIAQKATNAAVVRTLNGITGTLAIAAGANISVSTAGSTITIAATGEVVSVNGKTGTIVLTSADVSAASAVHTHTVSDITDLVYPVASVNGITGTVVLTHTSVSAASASHTHAAADITSGTLDIARIPTIGYTALSGVPTTFSPSSHTHAASDITSGTIATARLGSGTADSSTFLRGDNQWASVISTSIDGGSATTFGAGVVDGGSATTV